MKKVLSEFALQIALREFNQRYKTLWDLVEGLDDSQFLELRENPHFQALLKDIRLEEWSYDFFNPEESELKQAITKTNVQHEETLEETLEEALEKKENERSDLERRQAEEQREAEPRAKEQEEARLRDKQANAEQKGREETLLGGKTEFEGGEPLYDLAAAISKMRQQLNKKQKKAERIPDPSDLMNNIRLNYQALTEEERGAINRVKERITDYSLEQLLSLSDSFYYQLPAIGNKTVSLLVDLKSRVKDELQRIKSGEIDYLQYEGHLIHPISSRDYLIENSFQQALREDLTNFYNSLRPREKRVFSHRWAYGENAIHSTLEQLGGELGVTRERVRQIEGKVLKKLKKALRFSERELKKVFLQHAQEDLRNIFVVPIKDEGLYYAFIGILIGNDSLKRILMPSISPLAIGPIFAREGAPQNRESLYQGLREDAGVQKILEREPEEYHEILLHYAVEEFLKSEHLQRVGEELFYPQNLSKSLAAATFLYDYPAGLTWEKVSEKVNASGYSRTQLETERLDHGALSDLEYTYLCGKGRYAHIRFANLEEVNVEQLFDHIEELFLIRDRETLHLTEIERYLSQLGEPINYYVLRYLVNLLSEDYGLYFDGRSQKDNISLSKNAPRVDQKSLIVKEIEYAERSLSVDEIAELLKSKSISHASLYLEQLMSEGRVVHAEYGRYSTPEIAYKGLDITALLTEIDLFLKESSKPIDISAFSILNERLGNNFSNHLYASLVVKYAKERGWYRKGNIYSVTPLKYSSLWDFLNLSYREGDNIEHLTEKLRQKVRITRDKAQRVVYQWQYAQNKE